MIKTIEFDKEKFNNTLNLELSLKTGNLDIISEDERNNIEVEFHDLRKGTAEDLFEVLFDEEEGKLSIKNNKMNSKSGSFVKNFSSAFTSSSNVTIYLPAGVKILNEIKVYNGNMKISNSKIGGSFTAFNGNIDLINCSIDLKLKVFNGNLNIIDGIINSLKSKSFSGNITIDSGFDLGTNSSSVQTLTGNIKIDSKDFIPSESILKVKTLSGKIEVSDNFPNDNLRISKKIDFEENEFIKGFVPTFVKGAFSNFTENFGTSHHKKCKKDKKKKKPFSSEIVVEVNKSSGDEKEKTSNISKSEHVESILNMIKEDKITVDDAERLIKALS